MPRKPTVRRTDLDKVLAALQATGQGVARVEIRPSGEVVIIPGLTETAPPAEFDDLDTWRAQKNARRAAQGS